MTRFFTCMTVALLVSSFTLFSGMDEVITAMKTGNSAQLAKYFDNTIEITMPDKTFKEITVEDWELSNDGKTLIIHRTDDTSRGKMQFDMVFVKN